MKLAVLVFVLSLMLAGCGRTDRFSRQSADAIQAGALPAKDPKPMPQTLIAMARLLESQGRMAESEQILTRVMRENPAFIPVYNEIAQMMVRQRRFDAAIVILIRGLEKAPEDPVLLNNVGMCHLMTGRYGDAEQYFTRASAARPQDARYRANLALVMGLAGRKDEARAAYSKILPPEQVAQNMEIIDAAAVGMKPADAALNKTAGGK